MTRTPWRLVTRQLRAHWLRSGLTFGSLALALFLFSFVVSIVTTLDAAVNSAAKNRLIVQSAVSLYVNLPLEYREKIAQVPGVQQVSNFQWFGGYYQEESNFFAQFAVDHDAFFDMYVKDIRIIEGPGGSTGADAWQAAVDSMATERRGTVVGAGLARDFGWEVGDSVPIIPKIFHKDDGSAWEMTVVGIYEPVKSNVDDRQMFFRWDYLYETMIAQEAMGIDGVGTYSVNLADGVDPAAVIEDVDGLFANGPQKTKTTTEAAFQAIFVSMLGNVPAFMGSIGGAIVFAALLSIVNTMLMASRQRRKEIGILQALGFGRGVVARLMLAEALVLSVLGGAAGLLFAKSLEEPTRMVLGQGLPGFAIETSTLGLGLGIAVLVGLVAGTGPAVVAARMSPVDALRSEG